MKLTRKQKVTVGFSTYLLLVIVIFILIKSSAPIQYYVILLYILFPIITFIYEDDFNTILIFIISTIAIISLFLFLFLWLFQVPILNTIPLFKEGITNEFIIAFFTIILTVSTIINLIIYKKSIALSRLTVLNASLNNELFLRIKNIGEYPANRVKVNIDIRNKTNIRKIGSFNNLIKKEKFFSFLNDIKHQFWTSEESDIQYLEPKEECEMDILSLIKEHFSNLKVIQKGDERAISSDNELKFKVIVVIHYFNDAGDKAPVPALRIFKVNINKSGINFDR